MRQLQMVALGNFGPQGQHSIGKAMLEATRAQCPEASSPSCVQSGDSQSPAQGSKLLEAAECPRLCREQWSFYSLAKAPPAWNPSCGHSHCRQTLPSLDLVRGMLSSASRGPAAAFLLRFRGLGVQMVKVVQANCTSSAATRRVPWWRPQRTPQSSLGSRSLRSGSRMLQSSRRLLGATRPFLLEPSAALSTSKLSDTRCTGSYCTKVHGKTHNITSMLCCSRLPSLSSTDSTVESTCEFQT